MSITYTAVVVVGCKIPKDRVTFDKDVRGCNCIIPVEIVIEDMSFCPNCGKKIWITKTICSVEYNQEFGYNTLFGLRVFQQEYKDHVFVSGLDTYKDSDRLDANVSLSLVKARVQEILEPHDLWDEKEFGIWAFLDTY